ncbi:MAG: DUF262 domain-containing protein [Bacteroidota bacterium]|nr:DUF262 domain-containing protein [Bacteroidota bacterium]
MAKELDVSDITVGGLLDKLRTREWMIPAFQRDFVWSINDVSNLVSSILGRRPIGMATLWEQLDDSELPLVPVSIRDREKPTELLGAEKPPATKYAVLDGRQRCTAIAIAFGGLRPTDGRLRLCGRFFLNVASEEESKRIEFVREADVVRRGLNSDAGAIGSGRFPLSSSKPNEDVMQQWIRYTQAIKESDNYPDSELPEQDELERRNRILAQSFRGLVQTKLAVYTVPASYSLPDICDIFEVLNTTGTKVSTVDLIHSWLYSATEKDESPILLRDWIDKLGELPGAIGWSSSRERPELIAQIVTAAYVSLESKPEARAVGRRQQSRVTSIKSRDLLATPTLHWKNIIRHEKEFAEFLGDFQQCVSAGAFGWRACPYPTTAAIYVGLRWHHRFDIDDTHHWEITDLDALFRAFFWRNALSSRYDQGFLTQLGTDIAQLKLILNKRQSSESFDQWAVKATKLLDAFMDKPIPKSRVFPDLYSDRQTGALQKALLLPIATRAQRDLLSNEDINFPARSDIQLHHVYPQAWCRDNRTDQLSPWLDPKISEKDWIRSAANLIPLTRQSNLEWRAANPGAILREKDLTYASHGELFSDLFINEEAFNSLLLGADGIPHFWKARAKSLASHLEELLSVANHR